MGITHLRGLLPALLILAVTSVISIVFVVQIQATSDANNEKQSAATDALAFQPVNQNIYKPIIRIWIHGDSVRPSVIRTRPGVVVLRAENETRSDVSLVVEKVLPRETIPVARISTANSAKRTRGELILEPGEYVFYDAARPQFKGTLVVAPPGQ